MPERFDIQVRAADILSGDRLVETDALLGAVFDAEQADGVVEGDMGDGATARGRKSLLVRGDVLGAERRECRVVFGGDVVILGSVRYATISARNIWVGDEVAHSQLICLAQIGIGGVLKTSELTVGDLSVAKQQVARVRAQILQCREGFADAQRKLQVEERQMDRLLKSTQFKVNVSVGGLMKRTRNSLKIDLTRFYSAVPGRSPDLVDRALVQFFSKAVVGLLTRNNQYLIQNNTNRRKVFMGLIRALYDLFMLTRQRDRLSDEVQMRETGFKGLIENIGKRDLRVWINGGVAPEVAVQFMVPTIEQHGDLDVEVNEQKAILQVLPGDDARSLRTILTPLAGDNVQGKCAAEVFQGAVLQVVDGRVGWEKGESDDGR